MNPAAYNYIFHGIPELEPAVEGYIHNHGIPELEPAVDGYIKIYGDGFELTGRKQLCFLTYRKKL